MSRLIGDRHFPNRLTQADAWRKARQSVEANRPRAAAAALEIANPEALPLLAELQASPARFLGSKAFAASRVRREAVGLALIKLWSWLELQKNAIVREVKRLEIQVASLAAQLRRS